MTETIARVYYQLHPSDLTVLDYFQKPNEVVLGNPVRIFGAHDVRLLLYLKAATLAGIEDTTDARFLNWGAELAREALMEREKL